DTAATTAFVDVLANLQADGRFTLDRTRLDAIHGGPLADGPHTLHLQAEDTAGNVSGVLDLAFTLDTTAPGVPAFDLAPGSDSTRGGGASARPPAPTWGGRPNQNGLAPRGGTGKPKRANGSGGFRWAGVPLAGETNKRPARVSEGAANTKGGTQPLTRPPF